MLTMANNAGLGKLLKTLATIKNTVDKAMQPTLEQAGSELVKDMDAVVPRRTGALANSIVMTTAGNSTPANSEPGGSSVVAANSVVITAGDAKVRYAHLVEYGHRKPDGKGFVAAEPFFWPTVRADEGKIKDKITAGIQGAVKKGADQ